MKKTILATLFCVIAAFSATADVGMKQFGKIKSKETVLTGIEAGNGITVEGEYKISANSYVGQSFKTERVDASFVNDEFVKVQTEDDGKVMHIYGHARYSISVTNELTDIDLVVLHMPTSSTGAVRQWELEFVNNATFATGHTFTVNYAKTEGTQTIAYYFMSPNDFKDGSSYSEKKSYAVVCNDLTESAYLVQSCVLTTTAE